LPDSIEAAAAPLCVQHHRRSVHLKISADVFVAAVYINEVDTAFKEGVIDREQFDVLATAINTATHMPSVATPNGQAAFLFLLT
jgi:NhaB family Na+:H+ antiporter